MNYFTIYTEDDEHVGFLIMLADDGGEQDAQHGQFAIKLVDNALQAACKLAQFADNTELLWYIHKDVVNLFDENEQPIGTIRQQYLTIQGQHFLLNDLTGAM